MEKQGMTLALPPQEDESIKKADAEDRYETEIDDLIQIVTTEKTNTKKN